jgi:hypothetical protein
MAAIESSSFVLLKYKESPKSYPLGLKAIRATENVMLSQVMF